MLRSFFLDPVIFGVLSGTLWNSLRGLRGLLARSERSRHEVWFVLGSLTVCVCVVTLSQDNQRDIMFLKWSDDIEVRGIALEIS